MDIAIDATRDHDPNCCYRDLDEDHEVHRSLLMLIRSSRSAYLCLKCHSRLSLYPCSDLLPSEQPPSSRRRWQSSAAALAEEEDDYEDIEGARLPPSNPEPERQRKFRGRRWRPPGVVAQLGVPALGKPAEVLVLEPRDRRILKVPEDLDEEHTNNIQESLDSEVQPLSVEELTVNLEHIRAQFGDKPDELDEVKWKKVRSQLFKGFTTPQLASYVALHDGSPDRLVQSVRRKGQKKRIITHILRVIWELPRPEGSVVVANALIPKHVLRVLLKQKVDSMRKISERHNVQIELFEAEKKATLTGQPEKVHIAKKELFALVAQVFKVRLDLKDIPALSSYLANPKEYERFMENIQQRYGVSTFTKSKSSAVVVHYHQDRKADISSLKHLLHLAKLKPLAPLRIEVAKSSRSDSVLLVPYFSREEHGLFSESTYWMRMRQFTTASRDKAESHTKKLTALEAKYTALAAFLNNAVTIHQQFPLPGLLHTELSAQIGQVLFEGGQALTEAIQSGAGEKAWKVKQHQWKMTTDIPFLPSYLASQKTWLDGTSNQTQRPFLLQLRLRDVADKFPRAAIEILLAGKDLHLGLQQRLQPVSIKAILAEANSILLTPGLSTDVCFRKRVVFDVYRARTPYHPTNADLIKQLNTYFDVRNAKETHAFDSFVKLRLPESLYQLDTSQPTAFCQIPRQKAPKSREGQVTEYVLEWADVLDVASYRAPSASNLALSSSTLCLEHTIASGSQPTGHSHSLNLVEAPLLADPPEKDIQLRSLFDTAYELARSLYRHASHMASPP